jgi:hypothetical protein
MTDHTKERPTDTTDNELDTDRDEALEGDRPSGWAGVTDALEGTEPDHGANPLDDETPGSQGEVESGSEGDFGGREEPKLRSRQAGTQAFGGNHDEVGARPGGTDVEQ